MGIGAALDLRGCDLEAIFDTGALGLLGERAALAGLGPTSTVAAGGTAQLYRTGDGWVACSLPRPSDWDLVPAWLGCLPSEADPIQLGALLRLRTTDQLVAGAAVLGLSCSALGEEPAGSSPTLVTDHSIRPAQSLASLRVVNLASLWAGPLCANLLCRIGAQVTTVESQQRPDGARSNRPFFRELHAGQHMISLDFDSPADLGRLHDLIASADVVIEGSRPRALRQLGVDASGHVTDGKAIWLSITGHGRDHQNESRIGYGDDCAVAGGLVGTTRDGPTFLGDAIADPLTGLFGAAAVVGMVEAGQAGLIDLALSRVAAGVATDWIDALGSTRQPLPRGATR